MNKNFILSILLPLCSIGIVHIGYSQITVNTADAAKIKNGITYVVMKDTASDKRTPFVKVIREYWTLSEVRFITPDELEQHLTLSDSYLTLDIKIAGNVAFGVNNFGGFTPTTNSKRYYSLRLWTCSEHYFKKRKKKWKEKYKIEVAKVDLYPDATAGNVHFDGSGHLYNWGPGILKNQLQTITQYFYQGKNRWHFDTKSDSKQLKQLKTDTLFIPDYVFIGRGPSTEYNQKKTMDTVLKDYEYPYKIISLAALNQKILTDTTAFYYLLFIRSNTDKFIHVIDSNTGEIIDCQYTALANQLTKADMRSLSERIEESK
jgi:hypothetical protein